MPRRTRAALFAATIALAAGCGGGAGAHSGSDGGAASGGGGNGSPSAGKPVAGAATSVRLRAVGRFDEPVYVTAPRGDTKRLFVVERAGRIRIVLGSRKLARPFLDISSQARTDGERGLLSMVFAPDYGTSGLFYVYFTDRTGDIRIQEFRRSASSANTAIRGSARNLLTIGHREFGNHDGGQLQMGPDNRLYAGIGDGGGAGDPHRHGQSLGTRLAKLLRIDPRHPSGGRPYGVAGNPFVSRPGAQREIWAYGLRNPWRFSFDRSTGDLVIGDVGQNAWEEIDFARKGTGRGANYGWNVFEARHSFASGSAPGAVMPRLEKGHGAGYCSITGGYVVRDRALGSLYGRYVYGDLCRSTVRSVKLGRRSGASGDRSEGVSVQQLVSFGEDASARVYVVSLAGAVYRLAPR